MLVGSPTETRADVEDSMALARTYPVADARFYYIIPFPNTELFEWVRERGWFLRDAEDYLNDASLFENSPCLETLFGPRPAAHLDRQGAGSGSMIGG